MVDYGRGGGLERVVDYGVGGGGLERAVDNGRGGGLERVVDYGGGGWIREGGGQWEGGGLERFHCMSKHSNLNQGV